MDIQIRMDRTLTKDCTSMYWKYTIVMGRTEKGTIKRVWGKQAMRISYRFFRADRLINHSVQSDVYKEKHLGSWLGYECLQSCFVLLLIAVHIKYYFCYTSTCFLALERWIKLPNIFFSDPSWSRERILGFGRLMYFYALFSLSQCKGKVNFLRTRKHCIWTQYKEKKSCIPRKEQKQLCISVNSSARITLVHQRN